MLQPGATCLLRPGFRSLPWLPLVGAPDLPRHTPCAPSNPSDTTVAEVPQLKKKKKKKKKEKSSPWLSEYRAIVVAGGADGLGDDCLDDVVGRVGLALVSRRVTRGAGKNGARNCLLAIQFAEHLQGCHRDDHGPDGRLAAGAAGAAAGVRVPRYPAGRATLAVMDSTEGPDQPGKPADIKHPEAGRGLDADLGTADQAGAVGTRSAAQSPRGGGQGSRSRLAPRHRGRGPLAGEPGRGRRDPAAATGVRPGWPWSAPPGCSRFSRRWWRSG